MNSFYMTLLSDSSVQHFPNNTQSSFRTKLPKAIDINKGEWEMAMVEMIHPAQVYNVSKEESQFHLSTSYKGLVQKLLELHPPKCEKLESGDIVYPMCIPAGVYNSPEHLVNEINDTIQKTIGESLKKVNCLFEIQYSNLSKRIKFGRKAKYDITLAFHPGLLAKLGASNQNRISVDNDEAFTHDVDLYAGINHMFIYSDLADFTLLGDVQAQILRVVPFQDSKQIHVHKEFLNLHYVPVSKPYFDESGINIRGDTGEIIQFSGGKSMVKLHFRKKTQYL